MQGGEPTAVIRSGNSSLFYLHLEPVGIQEAVFSKTLMCAMGRLYRSGQPGGNRHRPLGTDYVLDGLCEGSHRGGLVGRVSASGHRRL